jgi:excisionase family DNA binding protein
MLLHSRAVDDEQYWRVAEVAERLRVNPETVRRWLREGKLRGVLVSVQSGYLVADSELRRFVDAAATGPTQDSRARRRRT